jgi:hypothetical protein
LGSGIKVIFNFDHGLIEIYDAKVDERINLEGDVVTGDHILEVESPAPQS